MVPYICLAVFLLAAFYTDLKNCKIPNALNASAALTGLVYHSWTGGLDGLLHALLGGVLLLAVTGVMYAIRAVGAGDVKLFSAIGVWTGWIFSLYVLMYSVLYAGAVAVVLLLLKKMLPDTWRITARIPARTFPFMVAVLPGALTAGYLFFV